MRTDKSVFPFIIMAILAGVLWGIPASIANEVNKGEIPAEHLDESCKKLPWGVAVWDIPEAVAHLKSAGKILWVDTRPESFFDKGTVRDAILLTYDKSGEPGNKLTRESLESALSATGLSKTDATIVFFCQGPKCHRSYNATYVAATQWGFPPEKIVWFRSGYPLLLKDVRSNPKMKRKAKQYISDTGIKSL